MTEAERNGAKVLVIDDDTAFLKFMEELLSRHGFEVQTVSNGRDGIAAAKSNAPDLILLDVMMPEMSGGMTAHHLSEDVLTQDIPIIFLTSIISHEQEMVVDNKDGSYLFLSKPIRTERLLEEIGKALGTG